MLVLVLSTSILFAQSRRNIATAGLFDDDSDKISAEDIYELERSFGSLGYDSSTTTVQPYGAFGIEISPTMYLGLIGGIHFNDGNKTTSDDGDGGTSVITNYQSPFNARDAFALNNNMGFHYSLIRNNGLDTTNKNKDDTGENTVKDKQSNWLHEIAFGMKLDNEMEFYIPLGLDITNNSDTTKSSTTSNDITTDVDNMAGNGGTVAINLQPTFSMPMNLGIFNKLAFNAGIEFDVYNNRNKIDNTTTSGSTTNTVKRDPNKEMIDATWSIGITPTFEWGLNKKISFMAEPTVGISMRTKSDGKIQETVTNDVGDDTATTTLETKYTINPSIIIPVGVVVKLVDWFEIRTGAMYYVKWNKEATKTETEANTSKNSTTTDDNSIHLYGGIGITLEEDFYIDLAFAPTEINLDSSNGIDLFDTLTGPITLQFSYRF